MNYQKTDAPPSRTTVRPAAVPSPSIMGRLIVLAMEIPPATYIAVTGHAPVWARLWLGVFLSTWLLATVVQAAKAQQGGSR
jgi:hypothetical protein